MIKAASIQRLLSALSLAFVVSTPSVNCAHVRGVRDDTAAGDEVTDEMATFQQEARLRGLVPEGDDYYFMGDDDDALLFGKKGGYGGKKYGYGGKKNFPTFTDDEISDDNDDYYYPEGMEGDDMYYDDDYYFVGDGYGGKKGGYFDGYNGGKKFGYSDGYYGFKKGGYDGYGKKGGYYYYGDGYYGKGILGKFPKSDGYYDGYGKKGGYGGYGGYGGKKAPPCPKIYQGKKSSYIYGAFDSGLGDSIPQRESNDGDADRR
ncbi:MAG: hypothetical protein SGARI_000442 [Bacillariaceae sp.]